MEFSELKEQFIQIGKKDAKIRGYL